MTTDADAATTAAAFDAWWDAHRGEHHAVFLLRGDTDQESGEMYLAMRAAYAAGRAEACASERQRAETVTRFEVIDHTGRALVRYDIRARLEYQDDDRTLKVFLSNHRAADLLDGDTTP